MHELVTQDKIIYVKLSIAKISATNQSTRMHFFDRWLKSHWWWKAFWELYLSWS